MLKQYDAFASALHPNFCNIVAEVNSNTVWVYRVLNKYTCGFKFILGGPHPKIQNNNNINFNMPTRCAQTLQDILLKIKTGECIYIPYKLKTIINPRLKFNV